MYDLQWKPKQIYFSYCRLKFNGTDSVTFLSGTVLETNPEIVQIVFVKHKLSKSQSLI